MNLDAAGNEDRGLVRTQHVPPSRSDGLHLRFRPETLSQALWAASSNLLARWSLLTPNRQILLCLDSVASGDSRILPAHERVCFTLVVQSPGCSALALLRFVHVLLPGCILYTPRLSVKLMISSYLCDYMAMELKATEAGCISYTVNNYHL